MTMALMTLMTMMTMMMMTMTMMMMMMTLKMAMMTSITVMTIMVTMMMVVKKILRARWSCREKYFLHSALDLQPRRRSGNKLISRNNQQPAGQIVKALDSVFIKMVSQIG